MRVCGASSERWRRILIFFALWTLLGLFLGSKLIIEHRLYGHPYPWFKALWWWLMEAKSWLQKGRAGEPELVRVDQGLHAFGLLRI